jgi:hypothetical protein
MNGQGRNHHSEDDNGEPDRCAAGALLVESSRERLDDHPSGQGHTGHQPGEGDAESVGPVAHNRREYGD